MSLTVRELIAIPTLGMRVLAGHDGLDREIQWAHSCELEEPWHWMGSGDLLMTIGHGLPQNEPDQIAYLRKLAEAGLSGLALAEGMFAPPLSDGARRTADQLAFPVLETSYSVPFVTLSRAVADSSQRESHLRLARVLRVYEAFRLAITHGLGDDESLYRTASVVDAPMCVVDITDGAVEVSAGLELDRLALSAVINRVDEHRGRPPAIMRATASGKQFIIQPLSDGTRWVLVTSALERIVDVTVMEHVATIMLIQLERRRSADVARLHAGGRLLTNLIQGRVDPGLAAAELTDLGVVGPPWRLSMTREAEGCDLIAVQRRLLEAGIAHVLEKLDDRIVILSAETVDSAAIAEVTASHPADVGVGDVVNSLSRIPEAVREARWALEIAANGHVVGGSPGTSLFLPRTVGEGQLIVARVLGALIDYDADHESHLVHSLEVFFASERSWQLAAKQLCIHKQTLIYRMRRVEEITGRQLSHLDDVLELHYALRTRALLRNA